MRKTVLMDSDTIIQKILSGLTQSEERKVGLNVFESECIHTHTHARTYVYVNMYACVFMYEPEYFLLCMSVYICVGLYNSVCMRESVYAYKVR